MSKNIIEFFFILLGRFISLFCYMQYIVAKFPSWFPSKDSRRWTCGMYTLKAVIEWFNGSQINNYKNYASGWLSRNTWYMLPWGLLKVLRHHWLSSQRVYCKWTKKTNKIKELQTLLNKGPVILLISHAYSSKRDFSFRRAFMLQHYISLWWYDDEKRVFYVYDSNTEKPHHKWETLPVGNILLEYDKLLRYRRLGGRWLYRNFAIAVDYVS
jgi:hypothetical protein